ncbi:MAG: hypothetical protein JAY64_00500 [Candidatus Thiodiazotropha weberae]|nr:hypothetical protein [Candidatus Thiodiazotropha lotti]MCW4209628.1 hypothetical protein [Candidatus Thiodiazotropha lotti]
MNISFTTASLKEDANRIIELLNNNIGMKSKDRFDWMYINNKMGSPHVILAIDEDSHNTIGMVSLFPLTINNFKNIWLAGDYFVKKEFRSLFVAMGLQKYLLVFVRNIKGTIITFPNSKSEPIIKRVGYDKLYESQRYVKLINYNKHVTQLTNKPLSKIITPIINVYFRIRSCEFLSRNIREHTANLSDFFDDRYIELLNKINVKYKRTRNIELLNWKYFDNPFIQNKLYTILNNGIIIGCIIYYQSENDIVIREVVVNSENRRKLYDCFITDMRKNKIEKIVYYSGNDDEEHKQLVSCDFKIRKPLGNYYYCSYADNAEFIKQNILVSASDDDM